MTTHQGACHCGAISFTFEGEIESAMSCNCSYCRRLGCLLVFGAVDALKVTAKPEALGVYKFNKHIIEHAFCKQCGIGTHGGGETPKGRMSAVNARCIPALDLDALRIEKFDGAKL